MTKPKEETGLQRIDPQALMQQAISEGSSIETLERLVALRKEVRDEDNRAAWHQAMAEFQKRCPEIHKTKEAKISTRGGGTYGYKYASLDGILAAVRPVLNELGLHVGFRVRQEKGTVFALCRISHEYGHQEDSGEVAMPVEQAYEGKGANPAQRVGIAQTYAKRYALLGMLGISPEDDTDGHGAVEGARPVQTPQRRDERPPEAAPAPSGGENKSAPTGLWTGVIAKVESKSGKTRGKDWTLWRIEGKDGAEFRTFKADHAAFARDAGSSEVAIEWEESPKKSKMITDIGPVIDEQPDLPDA